MRAVNLTEVAGGFRVVADSGRSQAAVMVLPSQAETGGPDTNHTASDQWLFVLSGTGRRRRRRSATATRPVAADRGR